MRFKGGLLMKDADLRCFPFDLQALPIHVTVVPSFSLSKVVKNKDGSKAPKDAYKFQLSSTHHQTVEDEYSNAAHKGCGHYLTDGAGKSLVEFYPCHVSGRSINSGRDYQINVFVKRPLFATHTWNLLSVVLLAGVAMSSFYADWSLAHRMGITLTVILIVAVWTRPDCLARVPYATLFDKCFKISLATAIFISFVNIHSVMQCGGYNSLAIEFLRERYQNDGSNCAHGWCDSTKLDCNLLLVTFLLWFCANAAVVIREVLLRNRVKEFMRNSHHPLEALEAPHLPLLPLK
jgi:hypothetical protein